MNIQILKPSPLLAPYVKYYWALDNCVHADIAYEHRIVPTGLPELTFYFENVPYYARKDSEARSVSMLNGQQDQPYNVLISGRLKMFSVIFQAYATKLVFGLPAGEIYNRNLPVNDLMKHESDEIASRLAGARTMEERKEYVEAFLMQRLAAKKKEYELNRITDSMLLINHQKGNIRIENLAERACLSRKQYERTFADFVGITPKKFLKVVRFQYVLHYRGSHPQKSLTEIAYDCGYYDQSHMINDFKQLSGLTPRQYLAECEPVSDYF